MCVVLAARAWWAFLCTGLHACIRFTFSWMLMEQSTDQRSLKTFAPFPPSLRVRPRSEQNSALGLTFSRRTAQTLLVTTFPD